MEEGFILVRWIYSRNQKVVYSILRVRDHKLKRMWDQGSDGRALKVREGQREEMGGNCRVVLSFSLISVPSLSRVPFSFSVLFVSLVQ